jgi:hypothetical protein
MRLWFQRMAAFLGFDDGDEESIRAILRAAALRSASIGIGNLDGAALPSPLAGHVEDLEDEALVISRPQEGPARRELLAGESLHLSIAADRGFHHGDVTVLGRWVAGDGALRALLQKPGTLAAVGEGVVVDISEGGLCARVSLESLVRRDECVVVRAEFPAIIPSIHARAVVAHVKHARQPGTMDLGLRFTEPQDELGRAIRALELRRVNRAGAA